MTQKTAHPPIVSAEEWQAARDELLVLEKESTRAQDALAAKRRRLPMTEADATYIFDTPDGSRTLLELFDGRDQLLVYQHMDLGPDEFCPGCTWFTDNVPEATPRLLADDGVTWVTISDMPLAQIEARKAERGWTLPFVSSRGTTWTEDLGVGGGFQLVAFLRVGDGDDSKVYRTYNTTSRGVDRLLFTNHVMDHTVYGRQQDWEDSPPGWPQQPTYG